MRLSNIVSLMLSVFLLFSSTAFANDSIDDALIVSKIKSKIVMDSGLSVFKINVKSTNGVVSLSGTVNSDTDEIALIQIAQSTDGVVDIDIKNLEVKNSTIPLSDIAITAKVKGLFIREKLFNSTNISAMTINVETNDGVVHLSGTAESQDQIDNAIKIANSVNGVKNVESRVTIHPSS